MSSRAYTTASVCSVYRKCLRSVQQNKDPEQRRMMQGYVRDAFRSTTGNVDSELVRWKLEFAAEQAQFRMSPRKFVRLIKQVPTLHAVLQGRTVFRHYHRWMIERVHHAHLQRPTTRLPRAVVSSLFLVLSCRTPQISSCSYSSPQD